MHVLIDKQTVIDEIEYEIEMINSALDSITLDFNARERLRQRRGEAREILNSIQQLPSAQPEQRWIPVTEKLPEYGKSVLCYFKEDEDFGVNHVIDEEDGEWFINGVTAWMPLPEPYREEGEQKWKG